MIVHQKNMVFVEKISNSKTRIAIIIMEMVEVRIILINLTNQGYFYT
jgi:hypothetical protein